MPNLLLKLVLTPTLIGGATLAGRRWGPAVSGWLVGLPFTSGPIALFLALDHGAGFAATAATGMLAGTISQACFSVAYSFVALAPQTGLSRLRPRPGSASWARRGPWLSFGAGCLAFAGSTALLDRLSLTAVPALLATVVAIFVAVRVMPDAPEPGSTTGPPPRWDAPVRMVAATAFVVFLTAVAPLIGPRLSGLLSPFPIFGATLAVFSHQQQGPRAGAAVLSGLLHGLFAPAVFFFVLAALLVRAGVPASFAAATVAALATQGLTLWMLRRAAV
jgi:hypothetical protein